MSWNNELDTHIYMHTHTIYLKGLLQSVNLSLKMKDVGQRGIKKI